MAFDEGVAQRVREELGDQPDMVEKKMFGGVALMHSGHMCCGVVGDILMVRIGPDAQAEVEFFGKYGLSKALLNTIMHIRSYHQRAIDRSADASRDDPWQCGLIIGGSITKGQARDHSDVDFLIIAMDREFEKWRKVADLFINRSDLRDYDGGPLLGSRAHLLLGAMLVAAAKATAEFCRQSARPDVNYRTAA